MKPTSIILLIFSVILFFAGVNICSFAEKKAENEQYVLFIQEERENGDVVTTFDISSEEVTKLVLNLNDANVNVISGSHESKVELINYPINTFTHLLSNGVLSIDDNVNFLTLFNLTGQGTQFHGLRHYLNYKGLRFGEKSVNVYLSDDITLEEMEITSLQADIDISECHSCLSYKLTTDKGDITLSNIADANKAELNVTEEGNIRIQLSSIAEIEANVIKGNCAFVAQQANVQTYSALTQSGTVYVDGNEQGTSYNASSALALVNCRFTVEEGDIIISEMK